MLYIPWKWVHRIHGAASCPSSTPWGRVHDPWYIHTCIDTIPVSQYLWSTIRVHICYPIMYLHSVKNCFASFGHFWVVFVLILRTCLFKKKWHFDHLSHITEHVESAWNPSWCLDASVIRRHDLWVTSPSATWSLVNTDHVLFGTTFLISSAFSGFFNACSKVSVLCMDEYVLIVAGSLWGARWWSFLLRAFLFLS